MPGHRHVEHDQVGEPSARPRPARRRRRRRRRPSKPSAARLRVEHPPHRRRRRRRPGPARPPRSAAGDVAAQEDEARGRRSAGHRVEGADPRGAHDRRPVDGLAQQALPGVELGAEQVGLQRARGRAGCRPAGPAARTSACRRSPRALLRKTVESSSPMQAIARIGMQVDEQAGADQLEAASAPRSSSPTGVGERVEARRRGSRRRARPPPVERDRGDRVGGGGQRLAGEDLAALDRAGEDRLQRAVAVLGGDDVAGDQRGDQREHPDRAEQQQHERDRQPACRGCSGRRRRRRGRPPASPRRDRRR